MSSDELERIHQGVDRANPKSAPMSSGLSGSLSLPEESRMGVLTNIGTTEGLIPAEAWPEGWNPFGGGSTDPEEQAEFARLWDARNNGKSGNPRYERVAQKVAGKALSDLVPDLVPTSSPGDLVPRPHPLGGTRTNTSSPTSSRRHLQSLIHGSGLTSLQDV